MSDLLNETGRIFNIQRFSIHDGPGIRTIVFFKGCRLRCRWCCNPESQNYNTEKTTENGKIKTVGKDVSVAEVLAEVKKDKPYYARSGGGVTLSGGEAMCQPQFALALLKTLKAEGYDTALETAGYYPTENIEPSLPFLDTVLMDIKNMNSAKHKAFTGGENEQILKNAKYIAQNAKKLIIRVPVIPTFNDTESEIAEIARFAKSLGSVRELHLLPYHRLGVDKYTGLGRDYTLKEILPPENEQMNRLLDAAARSGLECRIGG